MTGPPLRGQVFFAELPDIGEKPVLVVSNNRRNAALPTVLVARVTTAPKPALASIVVLPEGEPVAGRVLCDDIIVIGKQRLRRLAGGLSRQVMVQIDDALKVALGIA